eukprot:COSAG02_NODE_728_length_17995_cov_52.042244_17_plen_86_part_00
MSEVLTEAANHPLQENTQAHASTAPYQSASETGWRVLTRVLSPTTISAHQDRHLAVVVAPLPILAAGTGSAEVQAFHDHGILPDP